MPDLSASIQFAVTLDKSQPTPAMVLTDTGTYPAGVPLILIGYFIITQPDGITITGNFTSPDIFWSGSSLVQATKELRLDNANGFQQGGYTITYWIRAAGYTDTMLTKTFNLSYTAPVLVIAEGLDEFTPDLHVTDATTYGQSGFTFANVVQAWTATIRSVVGTNRNITGSGTVFDMNYLGNYYDSFYDITLTSTPSWQLVSPSQWVTVIDKLILSVTLQAQIPPTLIQLLASLTTLKSTLDAAITNCNTYARLLADYTLASAIYAHLIRRGQNNDVAGLDVYVLQLEKIFNNDVNPTYTNTNAVIPPYNWGAGTGSVTWSSITGKPSTITVEWLVGTGGFPGNGATVYTDARLANIPTAQVYVFRNGVPQFNANQGDGDTYFTKNLADNFLTFSSALNTQEKIIILILPL